MNNHYFRMRQIPAKLASSFAAALLITACAIVPEPLSTAEVRERVHTDQMKIYVEQEQIFKPVSFEEAVARALKYNLDYRLKLMESALAGGLANLSRYDMLPNLLATAGYVQRNNDSGGNSVNIDTGALQLTNSTSQERNRNLHGAEFSWNMLDFGVSYFRAKQQADQYLIAEERRRRVIQNILQDTRSAYWRVVGAQRLLRQAETFSDRARQALQSSREAEAQGLLPPKEALTYQRLLLDAVQLLTARRQELELSKRELAALMNITPGTEFSVVEAQEPNLLPVPYNVAELEEIALSNRPELREEDLRVRISADDARRQLVSLLPGISFNVGAQYDSNKYLYNNNWVDSGVRVSFNLFKALSLPAMQDVHKMQIRNDEARRLALSMAVLTQVRVSVERYRLALQELDIARESSAVDQRLASYARAANTTRADSELELIRAETRALNSEYQRYATYANAQTASGRIYNSLGLEVVPANLDSTSVQDLAKAVSEHVSNIESDVFPKMTQQKQAQAALRLEISIPNEKTNGLDASLVHKTVANALTRNGYRVADKTDTGTPVLQMQLALEPSKDGVRRARWEMNLQPSAGSSLGSTRYASTLPATENERAVSAFAESAVIANLKQIETWLQPKVGK